MTRLLGNPYKVSNTGSTYYKVGKLKIRIGDHIPGINITGTLNIIVEKEHFAVLFNGKLLQLRTYRELQTFLRTFVIAADCFISKKITVYECVENENDFLYIGDLPENKRRSLENIKNHYLKKK